MLLFDLNKELIPNLKLNAILGDYSRCFSHNEIEDSSSLTTILWNLCKSCFFNKQIPMNSISSYEDKLTFHATEVGIDAYSLISKNFDVLSAEDLIKRIKKTANVR